ncbi:MAG: hypothetical protein GOVbin703_82 [Prokaryotic dsDNA virus sp.]|nr:MAG: hypothetical protein GOVbin703_82 [Prokaryotic dsDNA virus sp.]
MKIKNPDKIAQFEKAIKKKYGYDAIKNPNAGWDDEKEQEYLESTKKFQTKVSKYHEDNDLVEVDGFLMPKRLLNSESNRTCPVCSTYSFDKGDDFYMNKFDCCQNCFIKYVDGREERWQAGWRPNKEK